jgi:hypothetical protein
MCHACTRGAAGEAPATSSGRASPASACPDGKRIITAKRGEKTKFKLHLARAPAACRALPPARTTTPAAMRTVIDRHGNMQRAPVAAARAAAQHAAPRHHGAAAAPRAATAHSTRRLLAAALVVLGAAWLLAQRRSAADHAWLLTPTLARSREPRAHAALIAADEAFPHTYSRIQPREDAAPSGAQLALARALLGSMPHKEVAKLVGGGTLQHVAHGEALGDAFNFQKGGYTRCAVAAYATVTYFCGAAAAAHAYTHAESLRGAGALRAAIAAVRRVDARSQGVFHVTVNDDADDTFGHVFALHLLPDDGTTQPYMRRPQS